MLAGIALSVAAAFLLNAGNIVQKYSVALMPEISIRRKTFFVKTLITSRMWLIGFALCFVGVGVLTIALSLTPLPVAQSIFVAGIVLLILISHIKLHERLIRQEKIGLMIVVVALIAISSSLSNSSHDVGVGGSGSVVVIAAIATLALTGSLLYAFRSVVSNKGSLYGVVSGIIYGVAALGTKGASTLISHYGVLRSIPHIITSPYPYVFMVFSLLGMFVFQSGLQRYQLSVVVPMTDVAGSCYLVVVGSIIFDERWPSDPIILSLRMIGFIGVLVGSLIVATAKGSKKTERITLGEPGTDVTQSLVINFNSTNGREIDVAAAPAEEKAD